MQRRMIYMTIAAVLAVLLVTVAVGDSPAASKQKEAEEYSVTDDSCEHDEIPCEPVDCTFTDGKDGNIKVPLVGNMFLSSSAKGNYVVAENMSKIEVTFSWDSGWDLSLKIGTGGCPNSGEVLAAGRSSAGEFIIVFESDSLPEGDWFAHMEVVDPYNHRGESMSYSLSARTCNCSGEHCELGTSSSSAGGGGCAGD